MTSWHATFGKVGVVEVVLEEQGKTARPFLQQSRISLCCCSIPLQKRIVDFASETPFHGVVKQLKMHYGFEWSPEVIRKTALTHANHIEYFVEEERDIPEKNGVEQLLCVLWGCFIFYQGKEPFPLP